MRTQLTVKRQRDALRALSLTDSLTGVANRRCFNETALIRAADARLYRAKAGGRDRYCQADGE